MSGQATSKILENFGLVLYIAFSFNVFSVSSQNVFFVNTNITVHEGSGPVQLQICRSPFTEESGGDAVNVVIATNEVSATPGEDYESVSQRAVSISSDVGCTLEDIVISDDQEVEAPEIFTVTLMANDPIMVSRSTATVTIMDPDCNQPTSSCLNGGSCILSTGVCNCLASYTGARCSIATGINANPVISGCPTVESIIVSLSGATQKQFQFTPPTCNDAEDGALDVTCTPSSGTLVSLSTSSITCTCTDSQGQSSTCFTSNIDCNQAASSCQNGGSCTSSTGICTCPTSYTGARCSIATGINANPVISGCPTVESIIVSLSGNTLKQFQFTPPTCNDAEDGALDVTCTPSSGTLVSLSTSSITCTCTDSQGQSSTCFTSNIDCNQPASSCLNGGSCTLSTGICTCPTSYTGARCSIALVAARIDQCPQTTQIIFPGSQLLFTTPICYDSNNIFVEESTCDPSSGSYLSASAMVTCQCSSQPSLQCTFDVTVEPEVLILGNRFRRSVNNPSAPPESSSKPVSTTTATTPELNSTPMSTTTLSTNESSPKPVSNTTSTTPALNQIPSFNELVVENSISSNSITLLLQEVDTQNGSISCYEFVVVKRSEGQSGGGSPDEEVPFDQVKSEPEDGLPYRSIVMTHEEYIKRDSVTIGSDGMVTRCLLSGTNSRRKRRSNIVAGNQELIATNSPLESSTKYDIFMRTYTPTGNGMFQYASSGYVMITTNEIGGGEGGSNSPDGGSPTVVIYAVVIIIIIVVCLIVAGALYVRLRKTHKNGDENVRPDVIYANEVFVQESSSEVNNSKGRPDTLSYETVENLERKDTPSYENVRSSRPSESPMWKQLAKQTKNRTRKEISSSGIKETSLNRTCERNQVEEANHDGIIYEEMPEDSSNYDQAVYVTDEAPLPFKVFELPKYVNKKKFQKNGLEREFKLLPQGQHHPWTIATKTENNHLNHHLNHHPTILPYDHSRVKLIKLPGIPSSDYYNASFIMDQKNRQAFIAAQGPHKKTEDFLRLIWQEKISVVVMVTPLKESGKKLCSKYWPSRVSEISSFGNMSVTLTSEQQYPDYFIRQLTVHPKSKSPVNVLQFHFPCWPYMGVPKKLTAVIRFIRDIKEALQERHLPILVHCSDGCGASGTLIGAFCLMDDLEEDEICVYEFVKKMRKNRVNMVQTKGQYIFLYDILLKAYLMPQSELSAKHLKSMTIGKNSFTKEFQALSNPKYNAAAQSGASAENQGKNRFANKIPLDVARPQLKCSSLTGGNNYINACFVNSYQDKNAILMTQSPLPTTVEDFWRLIIDVQCSTVVMLNETDSSGSKGCVCYWPNGGNVQYGNILVTCVNTKNEDAHVYRQFKVTHQNQKSSVLVDHFQLPTSPQTNITIWRDFIRSIGCEACAGPTVVHCIDGCGHSGVFVTVLNELQRLKQKQRVNVFETVQELRDSNPHTMQTLEQYSLCYEILQGLTDEN